MKRHYLLITDVEDIGKKGDVISAPPGFAINCLLPQQKAVIATPHALRMQDRLKKERAEQALHDKKQAEGLAAQLQGIVLKIEVKVDPEGHMYGSVGFSEIIDLFAREKGVALTRRNIGLNKPIKTTGAHPLSLKLNEGVTCNYTLQIVGAGMPKEGAPSSA